MFAVIETGGKQYRVKNGDELLVERLEAGKNKTLKFDKVLLLSGDSTLEVGRPFVKGAFCEVHTTREVGDQGRSPAKIFEGQDQVDP
jgi:ribosomal protein L21